MNLFEEQFKALLGPDSKNLKDIIRRYINANPDLKDYPQQQYSIRNPNYFSNLDREPLSELSVPKFYWLGFLWADGRYDEDWEKIVFKLKLEDYSSIEKFANAIGFDHDRIKIGSEFKEYNGEINQYDYCQVKFGCKPMAEDLVKYGLVDF